MKPIPDPKDAPITKDQLCDCLESIYAAVANRDFERAATAEHEMRNRVLRAIVGGHEHTTQLAYLALSSADLDFPRY